MTTFANTLWSGSLAPRILPATISGPQTKTVYEPLTWYNTLWAILGSNQ